jgi:hypothetical protein
VQTEELLRRDAEQRLIRETFDPRYTILSCSLGEVGAIDRAASVPSRIGDKESPAVAGGAVNMDSHTEGQVRRQETD